MKSSILIKISRVLNSGISTEPQALYLLAEVYKYLEQCGKKEKNKYPNLIFFRSWALHAELSWTPAKRILARFDKIVKKQVELQKISHKFINKEINFYMFYDLKVELIDFLKKTICPINNLRTT